MSRKYTAEEVVGLLRNRYADHQRYALFEQVANGTGWRARSWIDALVLHLWPSDGLMRVAFEVKVSRQDFLKELKNAQKNEWARQACNEFWFVAPKNVIKEQELPEGIGWMRPHGDTLAIVRHAQRKESEMGPEFVAAIARSIQKSMDRDDDKLKTKLLAEDESYKEAQRILKDLETFVRKNGKRAFELRHEGGVKKVLGEIASGDKAENEVRQIRHVLDGFQNRMTELFDAFLPVAYLSMVECDKLGNFIVDRYGSRDGVTTIAEKRALLAKPKRKRDHYHKDTAQRVVGAFDRMRRLKEKQDVRQQD